MELNWTEENRNDQNSNWFALLLHSAREKKRARERERTTSAEDANTYFANFGNA